MEISRAPSLVGTESERDAWLESGELFRSRSLLKCFLMKDMLSVSVSVHLACSQGGSARKGDHGECDYLYAVNLL